MMAKRFNYIPWLIGGAALWFLFRKPGTIQGINGNNDLTYSQLDWVLTNKEYRKLSLKDKKEYKKKYREAIGEAQVMLNYAKEFSPNKIGYRQYILTFLINNEPI